MSRRAPRAATPAEFAASLTESLGPDEAERVLAGLHEHAAYAPTTFRLNTLGADAGAAAARVRPMLEAAGLGAVDVEPVPGLPTARRVATRHRPALTGSAPATGGGLYVQNLSSQLAGTVLGDLAGRRVLDLAAAPGGKTLDLLQRLGPADAGGHLAAVEPVRARFHTLQRNVDAAVTWAGGPAAAPSHRLFNTDGRQVGIKTPGRFDAVMLDAPCSGEARIDPDDPATLGFWSPAKIRECVRKQKALLASAFEACAVGGRIAYCTCTINRLENEGIVEHLLARRAGRVEPIDVPLPEGLEDLDAHTPAPGMLRIRPTRMFSAFFITLLRRTG